MRQDGNNFMADQAESSENEETIAREWQEQRFTARQQMMIEARRQKTSSAETDGPVEQIKKIQKILRVINGASAATLSGLIVTFLIMNAQLILGNGLKIRFVPPLAMWEILLLVLVDAAMLVALIFFIAICSALFYAAACLGGFYDATKCAWNAL